MSNLLEAMAAVEHERWSGWEKYRETRLAEGRTCDYEGLEDPEQRWRRLRETPYDSMTDREKESDRFEARKTLAVMLPILVDRLLTIPLEAMTDTKDSNDERAAAHAIVEELLKP